MAERVGYSPRLSTALTSGSSSYPQWGLKWTYDRYANRTAQTITAGSNVPANSVTVNAATNQITGSPYAYDASGNMTNDGLNTLVYDAENRATIATNSGSSGTYTYDGRGLRVSKCVATCTSSTRYIFSGAKVIAEYSASASPSAPNIEYIYAGTTLIASEDNTGTYRFYQRDHLSNRLVTGLSGNILEQLGHYPYGESWYNATNDKLLFTTYERDAESGNDYAQARYYVSRLGRFSSVDPLAGSTSDPQSLNRYVYAHDLPVFLVDPSGQDPCIPIDARHRRRGEVQYFGGMGIFDFESEEMFQDGNTGGGDCTNGTLPGGTGSPSDPPLDPNGPPPDCPPGADSCVTVTDNPPWVSTGLAPFGPAPVQNGGAAGANNEGIDKDALMLCIKILFGVSTASFTASAPGDVATPGTNGSFTGVTAGVFHGAFNPLVPGPYMFTVTNDTSKSVQTISAIERLNGSIAPDEFALGYTSSADPFTNFSGRDLLPDYLNQNQIFELGNSLGFITNNLPKTWNYTPGPSNTEPGNKLLNCYIGYTYN